MHETPDQSPPNFIWSSAPIQGRFLANPNPCPQGHPNSKTKAISRWVALGLGIRGYMN